MKRTIKTPPREEWRAVFRGSAVRVGFHLSLSKSMLEMLCAIADGVRWDRALYPSSVSCPDNWHAAYQALAKRGLAERKPQAEIDARKHRPDEEMHLFNTYRLTPAGEKVVELLKLAGVFVEADAAINKRNRRA